MNTNQLSCADRGIPVIMIIYMWKGGFSLPEHRWASLSRSISGYFQRSEIEVATIVHCGSNDGVRDQGDDRSATPVKWVTKRVLHVQSFRSPYKTVCLFYISSFVTSHLWLLELYRRADTQETLIPDMRRFCWKKDDLMQTRDENDVRSYP